MRFITAQLCGIILLLVVTYLSLSKKRISLYCVRAYYVALVTAIITLVFDATSVISVLYSDMLDINFVKGICKLYLVCLVFNSTAAFNYLMRELYYIRAFAITRNIAIAITAIFSVLIASAPIEIHTGSSIYTYGVAVSLCYFLCLIFIIATITIALLLYKRINIDRRKGVIVWMSFLTIAAIIQYIHNELLLVGYASAVGLTFLFSQLENPVMYLDAESGLYNSKAAKDYVAELLYGHKKFYGFIVTLNTFSKNLTWEESLRIIVELSNFFNKLYNVHVFRTDTYTFSIITLDKYSVDIFLKMIQSYFDTLDDRLVEFSGITVSYTVLRDDNVFNRVDEFVNIYYYLRTLHRDSDVIEVNRELLEKIQYTEKTKTFITKALQDDRIQVYYQPIFDTRTNKFVSAEALLRILDEDGNIVPPQEFVEVAEKTGLIIQLGERIFEKVCQFISRSNIRRLGVEYIEINLSSVQCTHKDLFSTFQNIISKYNIDPAQINLEITETAQLNTSASILKLINSFVDAGIKFSLDDFGTGSSNLDYITKLPVNIVKFDYTLTSSYFSNYKSRIMFQHIVPMLKELGLEIVCEGVESNDMLRGMLDLGIEHIQGYYFSKPIPQDDYIQFLKEKNFPSKSL